MLPGLPLALRYNSKLWRMNAGGSWREYLTTHSASQPRFSENALAGWTSSLMPPWIELTGEEQLFTASGQPLDYLNEQGFEVRCDEAVTQQLAHLHSDQDAAGLECSSPKARSTT